MSSLVDSLRASMAFLPQSFRLENARLFEEELLVRLAERLTTCHTQGAPVEHPPPHFSAECTPPLVEAWAVFAGAVDAWHRQSPDHVQQLAVAFVAAGCKNVLLLLGQRLTPASLTDARAIPPPRDRLLAAATQLHPGDDHLTVAARALSKHVHRSQEQFWGGELRGSAAVKNETALNIISQILDQATWWNVFGHFQHDTVFEARVPSGHGARWGAGGSTFIGFLEPFDEEKCPTVAQD